MYACGFLDLVMGVCWYVASADGTADRLTLPAAHAGCRWLGDLTRLPFPVPDAPAAAVQQNSRGQRPQLAAPR